MGGFSSDAISFQQSYSVKSIAQLQLGRNICGALRSFGRSLFRYIKLLSSSSLAPSLQSFTTQMIRIRILRWRSRQEQPNVNSWSTLSMAPAWLKAWVKTVLRFMLFANPTVSTHKISALPNLVGVSTTSTSMPRTVKRLLLPSDTAKPEILSNSAFTGTRSVASVAALVEWVGIVHPTHPTRMETQKSTGNVVKTSVQRFLTRPS
ncbi:hypothetical protein EmuJ_000434600 [Echinococcus multilocularis]|uniref:Uncharacterized protein n=1 Tax=Echinococcus multilocularis TaxID=6211 RepID=A0A068Y4A6_ECHMU|nr:hypothetical protein EmuJ_000434600 [Echinococcus multilocularis]